MTQTPAPASQHSIAPALAATQTGIAQSAGALCVFPLLAEHSAEPTYLTLDEALDHNLAEVAELSEAGSVPELRFVNKQAKPVLLLDGEELIGARQNRTLNLTVMVGGLFSLTIPVSCVEAGRWSYVTRRFASAKRTMYAKGRAAKLRQVSASMRERGSRVSDQSAVWDDIAAKSARLGTRSRTGAMADIYAGESSSLERLSRAITVLPNQVGAVFVVHGQLFGLELFDSPIGYAKYAEKLVSSYALEAVDESEQPSREASAADVADFLARLSATATESFKAVGLGEDIRSAESKLPAAGLVIDHRLVHLTAFWERS